ncbi:hypothetical protein PO124_32160 [Bacillus licheniformis]|nr:hypothetical protein [Bacillus licheniformis]
MTATKIHVIGDVHGCFTVLDSYLKGRLEDDELYILQAIWLIEE